MASEPGIYVLLYVDAFGRFDSAGWLSGLISIVARAAHKTQPGHKQKPPPTYLHTNGQMMGESIRPAVRAQRIGINDGGVGCSKR